MKREIKSENPSPNQENINLEIQNLNDNKFSRKPRNKKGTKGKK